MSDYPHGHEAHVGYRCDLCDAPTPHTDKDTDWLDEEIYHLCRRIQQNAPLEMDKFKQAITAHIAKALAEARIEGAKVIGYRLDDRIDVTDSTIHREVVDGYIAELKRKERNEQHQNV